MDLMESTLFHPPLIILQTVIEEVRHRSLPLYNRLKALIKSEEKHIWVFYNEYRTYASSLLGACVMPSDYILYRETAIIREEGETPNDRNDRGPLAMYMQSLLKDL
jgi:exosome complex exonuclease DIS3/RRP44